MSLPPAHDRIATREASRPARPTVATSLLVVTLLLSTAVTASAQATPAATAAPTAAATEAPAPTATATAAATAAPAPTATATAAATEAPATPSAPAPRTVAWEYRTIFVTWDTTILNWVADFSDGTRIEGLDPILNNEGRNGWELVAVVPELWSQIIENAIREDARRLRLFFKKPIS